MKFRIGSILACLCAVVGLLGTLALLACMWAGDANLSQAMTQLLTRVMWVAGFVGLLCLAGEAAVIFVRNYVANRRRSLFLARCRAK